MINNYFKENRKFSYVIIFVIGLLFSVITFYIGSIFYFNNLENEILEEQTNTTYTEDLISIFLENEDGEYIYSTDSAFPTEGYTFNEEKSYCINESVLSYNTDTSKISVTANGTDNCYVYFDEYNVDFIFYIDQKIIEYADFIEEYSNYVEFDETKSYCINGSELNWNSTDKIFETLLISDTCYVYFDVTNVNIGFIYQDIDTRYLNSLSYPGYTMSLDSIESNYGVYDYSECDSGIKLIFNEIDYSFYLEYAINSGTCNVYFKASKANIYIIYYINDNYYNENSILGVLVENDSIKINADEFIFSPDFAENIVCVDYENNVQNYEIIDGNVIINSSMRNLYCEIYYMSE